MKGFIGEIKKKRAAIVDPGGKRAIKKMAAAWGGNN